MKSGLVGRLSRWSREKSTSNERKGQRLPSLPFDRVFDLADWLYNHFDHWPVPAGAYRTDLAEKAIAKLGDADTKGSGYERRDVELREGGE